MGSELYSKLKVIKKNVIYYSFECGFDERNLFFQDALKSLLLVKKQTFSISINGSLVWWEKKMLFKVKNYYYELKNCDFIELWFSAVYTN